ncbi:MAG: hypothetical protein EA379_03870 [Phycisphaerales bacterium]|nr:MAG: hypothetical protein EA379_03870 [Phycisphaerales bacterium]
MLDARRTRSTRLTARLCLACGYRGRELQGEEGELTIRCPVCGEDLYSRRARSYAEMEGIEVAPDTPTSDPSAPIDSDFDPMNDPRPTGSAAVAISASLRSPKGRAAVRILAAMLVSALLVGVGVAVVLAFGLSF